VVSTSELEAGYWTGVGEGAAEFVLGLGNLIAHPVDSVGRIADTTAQAYRQDGLPGAVNQFNPLYHTLTAAFEYFGAVERGNAREAGRQAFRAATGVVNTALIVTGVGGAVGGGTGAAGAAGSVTVRIPSLALAAQPGVGTILIPATTTITIPGRLVAVAQGAGAAAVGVSMMAAAGGPGGDGGGTGGDDGPPGGSGDDTPPETPAEPPEDGGGPRAGAAAASAARPTLLQQAIGAGVRDVIEEGPLEVLVHGTTRTAARELIDTQGRSLTATGGNHGGRFYTLPDADVARVFARRTAGRFNFPEPTSLVGVALPRALAERLRSGGLKALLRREAIPNPPPGVLPETPQWVFEPGALEQLAREAFFFPVQ